MRARAKTEPNLPALRFTVLGRPQPQGSVRAFMIKGKPRLTSDNAKMRPWRQDVGFMALEAANKAGWPTGGVSGAGIIITTWFFFARPDSAKSRSVPWVKPDWDKVSRAVGDALTGIVYKDDAQVVEAHIYKYYGVPERAEVEVRIIQ